MAIVSPTNVLVQIYSVTGALVASFYNNTLDGENLLVECNEKKNGGLDIFKFTVPSDSTEPLFNDMECQIHINGVNWFSGYAEYIPEKDTDEPIIEITGKGFVHKLKEKTINRSYTSQTLEYIIKDVANLDLGSEINVYYNVAKILVPIVNSITIEFKDKSLYEVFEILFNIANKDYTTIPYTWGVDKDKELYFSTISMNTQKHYFEGYHYQEPQVEQVSNKIVNKILTYRTTLADSKLTEYVATYQDTGSQGLYGLFEKKLTFPDYIDSTTIANIANGILEKYSVPIDKIEIESLPITSKLDIGFYALSNRRDEYFLSVNELEDITDWNIVNMANSTPTIESTEVFTGRKALKIVTAVGCQGDYMEFVLDEAIRFPNLFRLFVYLNDTNADITIRLFDESNNSLDLNLGNEGDLSGEWIKQLTFIDYDLRTLVLRVDYDVSTEWNMIVDYDVNNEGELTIDNLMHEFIWNIKKVQIIINNNNISTIYIDSMHVRANTYLYRKIMIEEIKYTLDKSYLADVTFGTSVDSLIDEIKDNVKDGNIALAVFSKQ